MLVYFFIIIFFLFSSLSLSLSTRYKEGLELKSQGLQGSNVERRGLMGQLVERAQHMFPLQFSSSYFTEPRDWLMEFFFFFFEYSFLKA